MQTQTNDRYDLEFNEQVEKVIEYHVTLTLAKCADVVDEYFELFSKYYGVTTFSDINNELVNDINEYFRKEVCKKDTKIDFLKYRLEVFENELQNPEKARKAMFNGMLEFYEQESIAAITKIKRSL